jgi:cytochrome c peroxidase
VPTLRNVDKRPSSDFVKAYGHNGYFKSLKAIVHFYDTSTPCRVANPMTKAGQDVLARTGVDRQHEHKTRRAAGPSGSRGGCNRELPADDERRLMPVNRQ